MDISKQIKELEDKGIKIIDALAGDINFPATEKLFIDELKKTAGEDFYSDILFTITFKRFNNEEAKEFFNEIIKHKYFMSQKLKRNVGVRIAALDYLANTKKVLKNVRLIAGDEMDQLMIFMNFDAATGVYNHRYFHEHLEDEILRAKRYKKKLSLAFIDVDNFKNYNDHLGHLKGDVVLRQIAMALKDEIRANDIVARYGGDEFVVLLVETNKKHAMKFAERFRSRIEDFKFFMEDNLGDKKVTLSIGISTFPDDAAGRLSLIKKADNAMYLAKKNGKNRIETA